MHLSCSISKKKSKKSLPFRHPTNQLQASPHPLNNSNQTNQTKRISVSYQSKRILSTSTPPPHILSQSAHLESTIQYTPLPLSETLFTSLKDKNIFSTNTLKDKFEVITSHEKSEISVQDQHDMTFPEYLSTLSVDMKRLDLIHHGISGNKFFKLKYNLQPYIDQTNDIGMNNNNTLITFGGPFSNHIAAISHATHNIPNINQIIYFIRGEELARKPLNSTLEKCIDINPKIKLVYISRHNYLLRNTEEFMNQILHQVENEMYGCPDSCELQLKHGKDMNRLTIHDIKMTNNWYLPLYTRDNAPTNNKVSNFSHCQHSTNRLKNIIVIPEGGTNQTAVCGTREIMTIYEDNKIANSDSAYDFICTPVGTGGTISGIISRNYDHMISKHSVAAPKILGFSAVPQNEIDSVKITTLATNGLVSKPNDIKSTDIPPIDDTYHISTEYTGKGYGFHTPELIKFIHQFETYYNDIHNYDENNPNHILIDHVYVGKMCYGVFDLINRRIFPSYSKILINHTGGTQGRLNYHEMI